MLSSAFDLGDGTEVWFEGTPLQAVRCAYLIYTRGDRNTWQWDLEQLPVVIAGSSVACGNWCALFSKEGT